MLKANPHTFLQPLKVARFVARLAPALVTLGLAACNLPEKADVEPFSDPVVRQRTEVGEVLGSLEILVGRSIEVSGLVSDLGRTELRWWGFDIGDGNDVALVCYERNWHPGRRGLVHQLLRLAAAQHQEVRVSGKLIAGPRLELDWVEYDGVKYDTDIPDTGLGTVY